jgi:hypothetical protein
MLFLIEYDRPSGKIVNLQTFDSAERNAVQDTLFEKELDLHRRGIKREVVLLEAGSEESLRRTHRRYFESLSELVASYENLIATP